jgi:hypothetical protein
MLCYIQNISLLDMNMLYHTQNIMYALLDACFGLRTYSVVQLKES